MALRLQLLQLVRRLANKIALLADRWASRLQSNRRLSAAVNQPSPGQIPLTLETEEQIIPLTNPEGTPQAGLMSYSLEASKSIISQLKKEELYGSGSSASNAVSTQIGEAISALSPAILSGLKAGQLYQVVGPAPVVQGLLKGTMQMVPSQMGGALGVVRPVGATQFAGQARFAQVSATSVVAPLMVYQAIHMIVGTQQINEINRRLASIERTLDRIVQRQNAKDLGEVIAAASTLRDILQEHQHSGHFNDQMRDRLSHCERDLRAHLERLKLLKSQFHNKLEAAKSRSKKRDRAVQLATLVKEEGEQFGQDTRLLIALCGAVMQLEQGLMAIALEHHPASLPYRQKQMELQMKECQETLRDMASLSEVQTEIRICLDQMNWWQRNLLDRSGASTLERASRLTFDNIESAPPPSGTNTSGSMLVWLDADRGIQTRSINESETVESPQARVESTKPHRETTNKGPTTENTFKYANPENTDLALAPSTSLQTGEIYWLPTSKSTIEVPIKIIKKTSNETWEGRRMDNLKRIEVVIRSE